MPPTGHHKEELLAILLPAATGVSAWRNVGVTNRTKQAISYTRDKNFNLTSAKCSHLLTLFSPTSGKPCSCSSSRSEVTALLQHRRQKLAVHCCQTANNSFATQKTALSLCLLSRRSSNKACSSQTTSQPAVSPDFESAASQTLSR